MTNENLSILMEVFTKLVDARDQLIKLTNDEGNNLDCSKDHYGILANITTFTSLASNGIKEFLDINDIHFSNGKFYAPISEIVSDEDENTETPDDGGQ